MKTIGKDAIIYAVKHTLNLKIMPSAVDIRLLIVDGYLAGHKAGADAAKRVEWVEGNRPEKAGWYAVTLKDGGSIYDRYDRYDWHIAHIGIVVAYARIDPPAPFVKDGKNGRD